MNDAAKGQVNKSAAEVYEDFFVPALFQQWTARVADAAEIGAGQRVLDVACGTGTLTREIAARVGAEGSVVGVDINDGMLEVARRKTPQVEWRRGAAEALPFEDHSFDAVVCQFALMFFTDRRAAIREMLRVLRPGGRLAVAVWDRVENSPGYAAVTGLLQRLFGDEAANALRAPFNLGDEQALRSEFANAGISGLEIMTRAGTARFSSIKDWMYTDVKGWTLADMIDDAQFDRLLKEAEVALKEFVDADGNATFAAPAHIVSVTKS
ncbi:MAG TPA: methyltransferase domain-containing protein [Gammaproteobacteria bacterium]|nr:methyltransferase domain-containing protein [Gammaproteobacteria bacterium]